MWAVGVATRWVLERVVALGKFELDLGECVPRVHGADRAGNERTRSFGTSLHCHSGRCKFHNGQQKCAVASQLFRHVSIMHYLTGTTGENDICLVLLGKTHDHSEYGLFLSLSTQLMSTTCTTWHGVP